MGKVSQQADTLLSFVLGPMERVRQFCLDCQGGQESFVTGCEDSGCAFFAQRLSVRENLCCAGGRGEVRSCGGESRCVLWEYRFGVMPKTYERVSRRLHISDSVAGERQRA